MTCWKQEGTLTIKLIFRSLLVLHGSQISTKDAFWGLDISVTSFNIVCRIWFISQMKCWDIGIHLCSWNSTSPGRETIYILNNLSNVLWTYWMCKRVTRVSTIIIDLCTNRYIVEYLNSAQIKSSSLLIWYICAVSPTHMTRPQDIFYIQHTLCSHRHLQFRKSFIKMLQIWPVPLVRLWK